MYFIKNFYSFLRECSFAGSAVQPSNSKVGLIEKDFYFKISLNRYNSIQNA
jgi:hypothetical protein